MISFLIQCTLDKVKFVSELIWLTSVWKLFMLEVIQKMAILPTAGISKNTRIAWSFSFIPV